MLESLFDKKNYKRDFSFIIKETLAQVLSCEFCDIFKNTFFTEHLRATAFVTYFFCYFILKESTFPVCSVIFTFTFVMIY